MKLFKGTIDGKDFDNVEDFMKVFTTGQFNNMSVSYSESEEKCNCGCKGDCKGDCNCNDNSKLYGHVCNCNKEKFDPKTLLGVFHLNDLKGNDKDDLLIDDLDRDLAAKEKQFFEDLDNGRFSIGEIKNIKDLLEREAKHVKEVADESHNKNMDIRSDYYDLVDKMEEMDKKMLILSNAENVCNLLGIYYDHILSGI